ncbi:FecCD family ABC transporter permease [Rhodocista pekingensis]|uniref:FecCD family ABC transporter permease n=1 Tax=Rhodocista pekingensis TaxID=201185 RepID=A0ABW2KZ81_9PROT
MTPAPDLRRAGAPPRPAVTPAPVRPPAGRPGFVPLLAAALLVAALLSLLIGPADIAAGDALAGLVGQGDPLVVAVMQKLRLPRLLVGLGAGAMLGLAGASLQGYLRNPLAEPSVLGVSNAAALGAVVALYNGFAATMPLALPLMAIGAAMAAIAGVMLLAARAESALSVVLAGLAVGTLCGALISLTLNLAPSPFAAAEISFWLLGSLEDRSMTHVVLALPLIGVGAVLLLWDGRALDALTLGEEAARSLGCNLARVRVRLMLGVAIGVGAAVAVSGAIGFVGLVIPHMVRAVVGQRPSRLLLPSALAGALLLVLADLLVRVLPTANEIRLGVVTALLGVPIFLSQLLKARRSW